MLTMLDQQKKLLVLKDYFLHPFYGAGRKKTQTHSFITLFFVYGLWWSKRKNSFCYNIIFCMLSLMEQEKTFFLLQHYFLYVVCDGAREKNHLFITLFFACCLCWSKRKKSFCHDVTFCILSMMEQEKKLILL